MSRKTKAAAAAVAALASVGVGAGDANAASGPSEHAKHAQYAGHCGDFESRLDGLVKNGTISAEQEKKIAAAFADHPAGGRHRMHGGHSHKRAGRSNPALAKALGLTPAQLRVEFGKGQSLAQIAKTHHKSQDDVVKALQQADDKRIADSVAKRWNEMPKAHYARD